MNLKRQSWYGFVLGPNPDYTGYDRVVAKFNTLNKSTGLQLRLLVFEGFPAALYLSSARPGDCDELLRLVHWQPCSLPSRRHFRLAIL